MLKVWTPKASREAENKSGITEGYLFNGFVSYVPLVY